MTFNLVELFKLGGPFMWVLLVFSIATFALVLDAAFTFSGTTAMFHL